jgi:DNA-binding transcriptional ArsR family regulator
VGEPEAIAGIRQRTLSQQLAVLRQERLVETEKDGKHVSTGWLTTRSRVKRMR